MLGTLLKKFEARRLNRDAVTIIESDEQSHGHEHLSVIAKLTVENLQFANQLLSTREQEAAVLQRLKAIHREARNRHDQTALSAATLAIIYFRAERLGDAAQPARTAIDRFLQQWRSVSASGTDEPS